MGESRPPKTRMPLHRAPACPTSERKFTQALARVADRIHPGKWNPALYQTKAPEWLSLWFEVWGRLDARISWQKSTRDNWDPLSDAAMDKFFHPYEVVGWGRTFLKQWDTAYKEFRRGLTVTESHHPLFVERERSRFADEFAKELLGRPWAESQKYVHQVGIAMSYFTYKPYAIEEVTELRDRFVNILRHTKCTVDQVNEARNHFTYRVFVTQITELRTRSYEEWETHNSKRFARKGRRFEKWIDVEWMWDPRREVVRDLFNEAEGPRQQMFGEIMYAAFPHKSTANYIEDRTGPQERGRITLASSDMSGALTQE